MSIEGCLSIVVCIGCFLWFYQIHLEILCKQVAQHYLDAVKNLAQTHVAATHTNNPAAETLLKEGYGIAFERLLREGDIPLQDQFDEDGNLIEMGKESHPAYADFCPEVKEPDAEALAKIEEENRKAFNKFTSEDNVTNYNLYKFKFYQKENY